jgi:hypothetical protein
VTSYFLRLRLLMSSFTAMLNGDLHGTSASLVVTERKIILARFEIWDKVSMMTRSPGGILVT